MSLSFAVKIPDGIVLITESRETDILTGKFMSNSRTKYFKISDSLVCAPVGTRDAILPMIDTLITRQAVIKDKNSLESEIKNAAIDGLNLFLSETFPNGAVPRAFHVAVLAGALLDGVPYIYGLVVLNTQAQPRKGSVSYSEFLEEDFKCIAGGIEQDVAGQALNTFLDGINSTWEIQTVCKNDFINKILDKAKSIIADVSSRHDDVGGEVKYVILRKGFTSESGIA
jgi:hypothetical protein